LKKIILVILIILIFAIVALNLYIRGPLVANNETVYLMVHPGDSFTSILNRADSLHLKLSPLFAKFYIKLYGAEKKILPGRYTITPDISRLELLRRLKNGSFDYVWITLPEGLTVNGAIKILAQKSGRAKAEFERLLKDTSFLASLPLSPADLEGYLFPIVLCSSETWITIRPIIPMFTGVFRPAPSIRPALTLCSRLFIPRLATIFSLSPTPTANTFFPKQTRSMKNIEEISEEKKER